MPIPWMDGNSGTETIIVPAIWTSRTRRPARPGRYEVNWASPLTRGLVGLWIAGDIGSLRPPVREIGSGSPSYDASSGFSISYLEDTPAWSKPDGKKIGTDTNNFTGLPATLFAVAEGMSTVPDGIAPLVGCQPQGQNAGHRIQIHLDQYTFTLGGVKDYNSGVYFVQGRKFWFAASAVNGSKVDMWIKKTREDDIIKVTKTISTMLGTPTETQIGWSLGGGGTVVTYPTTMCVAAIWSRNLSDSEVEEIFSQTRFGGYGDLVRPVPERKYVYVSVPTSPLPVPAIQTSKTRRPARPGRYEVNWASPLTRGLVFIWTFNTGDGAPVQDIARKLRPRLSVPDFASDVIRLRVQQVKGDAARAVESDANWPHDIATSSWTLITWFVRTSTGASHTIYQQPDGTGTGRGLLLIDDSTSTLRSFFGATALVGGKEVSLNTWTFGAITYDFSSTNRRLYNNGQKDAEDTVTGENNSAKLFYGKHKSNTSQHWQGNLSLGIGYDRALSDVEILELYNQTRFGGYGDLVRLIPERRYVFVSAPPQKPKEMIIVRRRRRM